MEKEILRMEINPEAFVEANREPYIEEYLNKGLELLRKKNKEVPCRENSLAITKIEEALMWLEYRTKDRQARGVEGSKEA